MSDHVFIEIINHRGRQIMSWSYPDRMQQEALVAAFKSQIAFMQQNPQYKYLINNVSNVSIGNEMVQVAKSNSAAFDKIKVALLGVTGLKKFLLWGYNSVAQKQLLPFDTKKEALEYLVND